eukprot:TRINITY_DN176_c0_g1_i11.p1 TRINITY_DN176_c0_g1~~TRINITY_DN176_c0_g1_i11.p1  ORF type:complete len:269 (-),score=86.65 TRINITY_DN176_c0_g1_i11:253-1059(-)
MYKMFIVVFVGVLGGVDCQSVAIASSAAQATGSATVVATASATATFQTAQPTFSPVHHPVFYKKPAYYSPKPVAPKPIFTIVDSNKKDVIKEEQDDDCRTIAEVAVATPELSTLVAALEIAGLQETLSDANLVATVLAPTNQAFQKLFQAFQATPEQVLSDPQLANILLYHVIGGRTVASTDLVDASVFTTALQQELIVSVSSDEVTFIGEASEASVVSADIVACKAVIHLIDYVLLPDFATIETEGAVVDSEPAVEATATATVTLNL